MNPTFDLALVTRPYTPSLDLALGELFRLGLETPKEPYLPTWDLAIGDHYIVDFALETPAAIYFPTANLNLGDPPPIPESTVLSIPTTTGWGLAIAVDAGGANAPYGTSRRVDVVTDCPITTGTATDMILAAKSVRLLKRQSITHTITRMNLFVRADHSCTIDMTNEIKPTEINYRSVRKEQFNQFENNGLCRWDKIPPKDNNYQAQYNEVRWQGVERKPIYATQQKIFRPTFTLDTTSDIAFLPTLDLGQSVFERKTVYLPYAPPEPHLLVFDLNEAPLAFDGHNVFLNVPSKKSIDTSNPYEVLGYESTPIQPVTNNWTLPWGIPQAVDYSQTLGFGFGINDFIVGGSWSDGYGGDTSPPPEPPVDPIQHIDYEVFRAVNIINIVVLPSNTPIGFDSLQLNYDIDSFAWVASFNVTSQADYDLIKPVGKSIKEIQIAVNNETFKLFVGSVRKSLASDNGGRVTSRFTCQAFSTLKKLGHPYSAKKSYTHTALITAAQAATTEAAAKSFTLTWDTTDWNIPAGVHRYQDKTPLGVIVELVNAIGGVIIPNDDTDGFTVRPRFPVSPWEWDNPVTGFDRAINESRFFSVENSSVPQDNPDGVFVFGEEQGVGVKAVRSGRPGTALLPDVVDKYMTTTAAAQERGRIEVAKASFFDIIPMSTYVDELGLIRPLELIQFTDLSGGTWKGQVMGVALTCNRVGNALIQTITVARFFDDE